MRIAVLLAVQVEERGWTLKPRPFLRRAKVLVGGTARFKEPS